MSSASTSTDRPRYRSSTIGSLQTLTRALRESLRLRRLRKQKRRNEADNQQMRRRSKSVGNTCFDDEISEIGISAVVASDIGPIMNTTKSDVKSTIQQRRQSKSVDDVEFIDVKKQLDTEKTNGEEASTKKLSANSSNVQTRRRSKDDHDLPKQTPYYVNEQKGFRKRFGRLFGSLKTKNQTHIQLRPETPTPSSASSPSTDCEDKEDKRDKSHHENNDESKE